MSSTAKRVVLETLGWTLLLLGVAAIFLPGPGLLGIFAGLALLSQQYDWADRRVEPVKLRALKGAAEGVASWPKITLSLLGVVILVACGILWIAYPPAPGWWPLSEALWLPGGMWTGLTQVASAGIALALIVYSFNRYHGRPDEIRRLDEAIKEADAAARPRKNAGQTTG
ncbi:PGPGW domain-containing protein [Nocardioides sp. GXQ0305]|uniref:PGPGW domain-containing protein n=1 Tax=Nocardioides sp. GXQ0305 TaxID=3423912 RepID=UPI003D7CE102